MTALEHAQAPLAELDAWSSDDQLFEAMREWSRRALRLRPADLVSATCAARAALAAARPEWSSADFENALATALYVEDVLARERSTRRRAA